MERIRIDVLGQEYTVVSDESPKYIRSLASRLSSHISSVLEKSTVPQNAAMALVAISYLDELEKSAATIEDLKAQKVSGDNKIEELTAKIEELQAQIAKQEEPTVKAQPLNNFDGAQLKLI